MSWNPGLSSHGRAPPRATSCWPAFQPVRIGSRASSSKSASPSSAADAVENNCRTLSIVSGSVPLRYSSDGSTTGGGAPASKTWSWPIPWLLAPAVVAHARNSPWVSDVDVLSRSLIRSTESGPVQSTVWSAMLYWLTNVRPDRSPDVTIVVPVPSNIAWSTDMT